MLKNGENILLDVRGRRHYCPVELAMDVLGGKRKGVILWYLAGRTLRFGELKKCIVTISERVLTRELREMEAAGLISRAVYAEVPPKVEHCLSEYGQTLLPLPPPLHTVSEFGMGYAAKFGRVV